MGEVNITINLENGEIAVEGMDYQGTECVHDMDELQNLIGLKTVREETKPEMVHDISVIKARRE